MTIRRLRDSFVAKQLQVEQQGKELPVQKHQGQEPQNNQDHHQQQAGHKQQQGQQPQDREQPQNNAEVQRQHYNKRLPLAAEREQPQQAKEVKQFKGENRGSLQRQAGNMQLQKQQFEAVPSQQSHLIKESCYQEEKENRQQRPQQLQLGHKNKEKPLVEVNQEEQQQQLLALKKEQQQQLEYEEEQLLSEEKPRVDKQGGQVVQQQQKYTKKQLLEKEKLHLEQRGKEQEYEEQKPSVEEMKRPRVEELGHQQGQMLEQQWKEKLMQQLQGKEREQGQHEVNKTTTTQNLGSRPSVKDGSSSNIGFTGASNAEMGQPPSSSMAAGQEGPASDRKKARRSRGTKSIGGKMTAAKEGSVTSLANGKLPSLTSNNTKGRLTAIERKTKWLAGGLF
jgi:hypothetical protein